MLEELHIQNFALIDRVVVRFERGFNVLTGETGAGKSILVGALSLVLGARVERGIIRSGNDECIVSALFNLSGAREALAWINERGISTEDSRVLVRRSVREQKRGSIYVQSVPVTRTELEEFSALLINLHGQHEYQSVVSTEKQRRLLDGFGGLTDTAATVNRLYTELTTVQKRFDTLNARGKERANELELLHHAVEEIKRAAIQEGEEYALEQEIRKLTQYEKLNRLLQEGVRLLSEHEGGALGQMRLARSQMEQAAAIDTEMVQYSQKIDSLFFEVEESVRGIAELHRTMRFSSERLHEAQGRYDHIMTLKTKYGESVAKVNAYAIEAEAQIQELTSWEENRERLRGEILERQSTLLKAATALSAKRVECAARFARRVSAVVRTLGMPHAQFEVGVARQVGASGAPLCGPFGIDTIEFRVSANVGEAPQRVQQVASGGELSRIMLAIKTVFAATEEVDTLIFDEVDSGIGGQVALSVGVHLSELAHQRQVICITHIASIAARAGTHLVVEKRVQGERTVTKVRHIDATQREVEVARMLAGDRDDHTSRAHAAELLRGVRNGSS